MPGQKITGIAVTLSGLLICLLFFAGSPREGGGRTAVTPETLQTSADEPTCIQVGEELDYAVSYSFFSIGTISLKILDKGVRNGRPIFKARAVIESNPSLSWLTEIHIRFYGEIDDSIFSHYWVSEDSSKAGIDYHTLTFSYGDHRLMYEKGNVFPSGERKIANVDTVSISGPVQDGLSLFYYAREHVRQKKEVNVPTVIDNKVAATYIDFQNKIEDADIDAVDYPVETVFFNGRADFVGVVGMTGGFRGWFSNDSARIPIIARLNVWLGSIKVELKSWKRQGWQPPRYTDGK